MTDMTEKSPIDLMADLLAVMATRAAESERKAESFKNRSDEWYKNWQRKDAQLNEAEAKLAAEFEEHQRTRQELREAVRPIDATTLRGAYIEPRQPDEKGAQQNG